MPGAPQLVLDLGHRPAMGREDFWVAPGNQDAVDWIDRWPQWPGHALALFGPAGCGKSHLAQVFALRTRARVIAPADITIDAVPVLVESAPALAVENADAVADPRALFHLYNALQQRGRFLLLIAREAPARWRVKLADLKSRLASVPAIGIDPPDDAMIEAVLVKLFADRQLIVAPEVIGYLARHMDRSFAAMRSLVARADTASLAGKRPVTVPLVRALIE
jgi:DnaA regulatory inactivator Hda